MVGVRALEPCLHGWGIQKSNIGDFWCKIIYTHNYKLYVFIYDISHVNCTGYSILYDVICFFPFFFLCITPLFISLIFWVQNGTWKALSELNQFFV